MSELDSAERRYQEQLAVKNKTIVSMMRFLAADLVVAAKSLERKPVGTEHDYLIEEVQARGMEIDRACIERQSLIETVRFLRAAKGRG